MPSANKDRITVSLHVDKDIYKLAKRWSRIEGKPISRLFDEVFAPHVEAYKYPTPEDWYAAQAEMQLEKESFDSPEIDRAIEQHETKQKYWASLSEAKKKEAIEEMLEKTFAQEKEYRERWINALKDE
jgi:hypothetical protein